MPGKRSLAELTKIDRLTPGQALVLAYGLIVPLVIVDHTAERDLNIAVFYLAPVMIAGWRCSLRSAILVSVISAAARDSAIELSAVDPFPLWIHVWNLTARLFFYGVVSVLLHRLRATMQRLVEQSRIDPLTGLLNRAAFIYGVEQELLRQKRKRGTISLAYLDIDHFKQINDTFGHSMGDQALIAVSKVLRARMRRTDIVGRLGGDEFAILMPDADSAAAKAALLPLREMLVKALARQELRVTFSIGVISCDACADTNQLLHEADALMYAVKRNGRGGLRQRCLIAA